MRTKGSRCEAPRDRSCVPVRRSRPNRSDAELRRSTCYPERAPPPEPARSDTRTIESHGALDSARLRRHRSPRRTAPAGTASASWCSLALIGNEPTVRQAISLPVPVDRRSEERGTIGAERDQVLQRDQPNRFSREAEGTFDREAKDAAAGKHRHQQWDGSLAAEQRRDQRERQRMGDDRAGITNWIDASNRSRKPQLLVQQFRHVVLIADMADNERRDRDLLTERTDRVAHGIIFGQVIGKAGKSADTIQCLPPNRDRRAKAWLRQAKAQCHDDLRDEVRIDRACGKSRPDARAADPVVEARDRADSRRLQLRN